jgi:predicted transposase/invertase (TIGR01784 family)
MIRLRISTWKCPSEPELTNRKECWLFILNNLSDLTEIPLTLSKDAVFQKVFEVALLSNLTKEEMNAYELSLKDLRDYENTIEYARDMGMEQGIEKAKIQTALKMFEKGTDIEYIREVTDLPIETLQKLSPPFLQ